MNSAFVRLNDVGLHVVHAGEAHDECMIFLHGFPESHLSWAPYLKAFSTSHHVVAPDNRGFGESDKPQNVAAYDMQKIVAGLTKTNDGRKVPSIVFTKGGALWLEAQAEIGADALGLDWTVDIGSARKRVGEKVALQGNLDPAILLSTPEAIEKEVASILASYGSGNGHVFNLGHGITQWTPPENAAAFLSAVREHSEQYHLPSKL